MPRMGKNSRLKNEKRSEARKAEAKIIHTTKLFGGKETAADVHRQCAWTGSRCDACGDKTTVIQISTHMLTKELVEKHPVIAARIMMSSEDGNIPSWESKYGRMTRVGVAYACDTHRAQAERAAAHGPSNVLVEIDRGPGVDKVVVQVPGVIEKAKRLLSA